jgi:hypothetical protein
MIEGSQIWSLGSGECFRLKENWLRGLATSYTARAVCGRGVIGGTLVEPGRHQPAAPAFDLANVNDSHPAHDTKDFQQAVPRRQVRLKPDTTYAI